MNRRIRLAATAACLAWPLLWAPARAEDEVPFITTPDHVTLAMLQVAAVKEDDFVVDLGSGDGRIVITAAKRMGARGLGVEIVPDLVARSREHARRAGVADKVVFRQQDLFDTSLAEATVITMYLLPELNLRLRPRLLALKAGTRIVSHDWDMGDWQPDRSLVLDVPDKAVGREKSSRVHLWVVPARVEGLWCAKGMSLRIEQRFQHFSAVLTPGAAAAAPSLVYDGSIDPADGVTLRPRAAVALALRHSPRGLTVLAPPATLADLQDAVFQPAGASGC